MSDNNDEFAGGKISTNIHKADRRRGVVGYTANTVACPGCGLSTNTMFRSAWNVWSIACSQKCIDKLKSLTVKTA